MKTITIMNRKGGTAKTTTCASIGQCFARQGKRVLFIDLDDQKNLSTLLDPRPHDKGVVELLEGTPLEECVTPTQWGDLAQASARLTLAHPTGKALRNALEGANYDVCMIDCPPALSSITLAGIIASDGLIIPVQADTFSLQGTKQLFSTLKAIEQQEHTHINVYGILLVRYQPRQIMAGQALSAFKKTAKAFGTKVFTAYIRESVTIREAQATKTDIYTYAKTGTIATDYRAVCAELLEEM